MLAGLVPIEANGAHPMIEAVGIVIAPLFFIFLIILCWEWAFFAQSPTQPSGFGRGIAIVAVVVVCIVGAIHCRVSI
jgi:hypothetical protein